MKALDPDILGQLDISSKFCFVIQVFEAGRDANYSSDEEREAEQRESDIPSTLFFEGKELTSIAKLLWCRILFRLRSG